jgi:hypothetical protein
MEPINCEVRSLAVECKDVLSVLLQRRRASAARYRFASALIAELTPSRGKAKRLIITADSGGGNGYRVRLWKVEFRN